MFRMIQEKGYLGMSLTICVLASSAAGLFGREADDNKMGKTGLVKFEEKVPAYKMIFKCSLPSEEDVQKGVYFKYLNGLVLDKEGNLYAVDAKVSSITKFDANGKFIRNIGRIGQGPGEFGTPKHICIDDDGNIIFSDTGNGRIQILGPDGKYLKSFKTFKSPQGIVLYKGKLYIINKEAEPGADLWASYDMQGNRLGSFGKDKRLDVPKFMDVDYKLLTVNDKGELFVGWEYFPWIDKFSSSGEFLKSIELRSPWFDERGGKNYRTAKSGDPDPKYVQLMSSLKAYGDRLYGLTTGKNVEIQVFNEDGALVSTYWAECPEEKSIYKDFVMKDDKENIIIFLTMIYPEARIDLYTFAKRRSD